MRGKRGNCIEEVYQNTLPHHAWRQVENEASQNMMIESKHGIA